MMKSKTPRLLLALDIGNTHCCAACIFPRGLESQNQSRTEVGGPVLDGKVQITSEWRISTHPLPTEDELHLKLTQFLSSKNLTWNDIDAVVVSSVVPAFSRVLKRSPISSPLHFISYQWPFSFVSAVESPAEVGCDRLVNAEAAVCDYGSPCLIVDFGTATTLCAITRVPEKSQFPSSQFIGGAIIPGLNLSVDALATKTAQLFSIELSVPKKAIGRNTLENLQSGIVLGHACLIDGMVRRFKKELGFGNIPVIATGGHSGLFKSLSEEITHYDPQLGFRGMAYVYESFQKDGQKNNQNGSLR